VRSAERNELWPEGTCLSTAVTLRGTSHGWIDTDRPDKAVLGWILGPLRANTEWAQSKQTRKAWGFNRISHSVMNAVVEVLQLLLFQQGLIEKYLF